jgi:hypothetical protein
MVLPGRTSKRDLVADLADALGHRGMKLMLYYHLGASNDAEWMQATGAYETDTSKLFGNWEAIISEAGNRYKDRLAGWWFDDGSTGGSHADRSSTEMIRPSRGMVHRSTGLEMDQFCTVKTSSPTVPAANPFAIPTRTFARLSETEAAARRRLVCAIP